MKARSILCYFLVTLLAFVICLPRTVVAEPPTDAAKQEPRLTLDAARRALIAMIEKKESDADRRKFFGLEQLKAGKNIAAGDDKDGVPEGVWSCRLEKRDFVFVRPLGPKGIYSCSGSFQMVDGKWQATIKPELHAH